MYDNFVEFFFVICLFINAALFVPQFFRIIKTKHARDASLLTFGGFNVINLFYVLHGIVRHDWILTLGCSLSVLTNTCVTFAIIWYRYIKKNNSN